jgi:hypothetical protein
MHSGPADRSAPRGQRFDNSPGSIVGSEVFERFLIFPSPVWMLLGGPWDIHGIDLARHIVELCDDQGRPRVRKKFICGERDSSTVISS